MKFIYRNCKLSKFCSAMWTVIIRTKTLIRTYNIVTYGAFMAVASYINPTAMNRDASLTLTAQYYSMTIIWIEKAHTAFYGYFFSTLIACNCLHRHHLFSYPFISAVLPVSISSHVPPKFSIASWSSVQSMTS